MYISDAFSSYSHRNFVNLHSNIVSRLTIYFRLCKTKL